MRYEIRKDRKTGELFLIIKNPPKHQPPNKRQGVVTMNMARHHWRSIAEVAVWEGSIMIPDTWGDELKLPMISENFSRKLIEDKMQRDNLKKQLQEWQNNK